MKNQKGKTQNANMVQSRVLSVAPKNKNRKSSLSTPLVFYRWGQRRSPSALVRVSMSSRQILDQISDYDRRRWLDQIISFSFQQKLFTPLLKDQNI